MNISIEIQESQLKTTLDKYIQNALQYSEYNQSELTKAIIAFVYSSLKEQIKEINMDQLIRQTAEKYIHGIVEDVVKRKITDLARASIKELKDRGELLK